jgi:mRNA interferase MazF
MKEGDIALAVMPQFDQRGKHRPVIILRELPPYRDFLVCGISSQLRQPRAQFDEVISAADPDFKASGLLASSLIRLGFLSVLPRDRIVGPIGAVSSDRHRRLLRTLASYLTS